MEPTLKVMFSSAIFIDSCLCKHMHMCGLQAHRCQKRALGIFFLSVLLSEWLGGGGGGDGGGGGSGGGGNSATGICRMCQRRKMGGWRSELVPCFS